MSFSLFSLLFCFPPIAVSFMRHSASAFGFAVSIIFSVNELHFIFRKKFLERCAFVYA